MAFSVINDPAAISATGVWGFNILTSVGIIMVNKLVLSGYDFKYRKVPNFRTRSHGCESHTSVQEVKGSSVRCLTGKSFDFDVKDTTYEEQ